MFYKILDSIDEVKQKIDKFSLSDASSAVAAFLKEVFTCIVCKEVVNKSSRPVVYHLAVRALFQLNESVD